MSNTMVDGIMLPVGLTLYDNILGHPKEWPLNLFRDFMDMLAILAQSTNGARLIAAGNPTSPPSYNDLLQLHRLSMDLVELFRFYERNWGRQLAFREWNERRREQGLLSLDRAFRLVVNLAQLAERRARRTLLWGVQIGRLLDPDGRRPRLLHRTLPRRGDERRLGHWVYVQRVRDFRTQAWPGRGD